jgi:hypothetical protein
MNCTLRYFADFSLYWTVNGAQVDMAVTRPGPQSSYTAFGFGTSMTGDPPIIFYQGTGSSADLHTLTPYLNTWYSNNNNPLGMTVTSVQSDSTGLSLLFAVPRTALSSTQPILSAYGPFSADGGPSYHAAHSPAGTTVVLMAGCDQNPCSALSTCSNTASAPYFVCTVLPTPDTSALPGFFPFYQMGLLL